MALALSAGVLAAAPSSVMAATATGHGTMAPMLAPTCSLNACNGTDPHATHCDATAVNPVPAVNIYIGSSRVGTLQLRFSNACRTIWSRVTYTGDSGIGPYTYVATGIYRDGGVHYSFIDGTCNTGLLPNSFCEDYVPINVGSYGEQIYDGGYTGYARGAVCGPTQPDCQAGWEYSPRSQSY